MVKNQELLIEDSCKTCPNHHKTTLHPHVCCFNHQKSLLFLIKSHETPPFHWFLTIIRQYPYLFMAKLAINHQLSMISTHFKCLNPPLSISFNGRNPWKHTYFSSKHFFKFTHSNHVQWYLKKNNPGTTLLVTAKLDIFVTFLLQIPIFSGPPCRVGRPRAELHVRWVRCVRPRAPESEAQRWAWEGSW